MYTPAKFCPLCKGKLKTMVRTISRCGGRYKRSTNQAVCRYHACPSCKVVVRLMRWSPELREPKIEKVVVERYT
jgi:hypothetical protein